MLALNADLISTIEVTDLDGMLHPLSGFSEPVGILPTILGYQCNAIFMEAQAPYHPLRERGQLVSSIYSKAALIQI